MLLLPPVKKRKKSGNTVNNSITTLVLHKKKIQTLQNGAATAQLIRCVNPLATAGSRREPARIVQVITAGVTTMPLTQQ